MNHGQLIERDSAYGRYQRVLQEGISREFIFRRGDFPGRKNGADILGRGEGAGMRPRC